MTRPWPAPWTRVFFLSARNRTRQDSLTSIKDTQIFVCDLFNLHVRYGELPLQWAIQLCGLLGRNFYQSALVTKSLILTTWKFRIRGFKPSTVCHSNFHS